MYKFTLAITIICLAFASHTSAQSFQTEVIELPELQMPKYPLPEEQRTYTVSVQSPYNVTSADITAQAKAKHEQDLVEYKKKLLNSDQEFKDLLKEYDAETKKANEKFEKESEAFKKLSLLERLSMTDQGKNPKLQLPTKPVYVKPAPPEYQAPNFSDYIIVDNAVLASQITIQGLAKTGKYLDVQLSIQKANFQDNAGQTYINQPINIVVKASGKELVSGSFFTEYQFLSSSPTNNINQPLEEKNYLNKVIGFINKYLNENFGYISSSKKLEIELIKNKGKYDDLERADILVKTNLRKIQASADASENEVAIAGIQKGFALWQETLKKVEYKNPKADFNSKIAKYIYFNLIKVSVAINDKKAAELYLNSLQENLVDIDLSKSEEKEIQELEKIIYKKTK